MTMHEALRPKDDIDRLYGSKKERGLVSIENCVDASKRRFKDYIMKSKFELIT